MSSQMQARVAQPLLHALFSTGAADRRTAL